ncbi:hypothetical protein ACO0LB_10245 [Undibacterium sp. SXout7W]|uniref:hypothetical protein n=1 Tax=Undibacterium sp. SXout7W TaxID=3413049 RepID=UPI003BF334DC
MATNRGGLYSTVSDNIQRYPADVMTRNQAAKRVVLIVQVGLTAILKRMTDLPI